MPVLKKSGPKLLRIINGKEHAKDEHFLETDPELAKAYFGDNGPPRKIVEEEDIMADPASSSDVEEPQSRLDTKRPLKVASKSTTATKNIFAPPEEWKAKTPSQSARITTSRANTYGKGRDQKTSRTLTIEGKENARTRPSSSSSKRSADDSDEPFGSMAYGNRTKVRRVDNAVKKTILKPFSVPQKTFGKQKSYTSTASSQASNPMRSQSSARGTQTTPATNDEDDSDASDLSMVSLPEIKPKAKRKLARQPSGTSEAEEQLLDLNLPKRKSKKNPSPPPKPRPTLSFLDAYKNPNRSQASEPATSQKSMVDPPSSMPLSPNVSDNEQERVEDLEQYLAEQRPTDSDDACPNCAETVDQTFFWEWWKGKKDTIRNQSLFCREHKRRTAEEEYKKRAYPIIDWSAIPDRIQQHRKHLIAVLKNKKHSTYRKELEEKAAQGRHKVSVNDFMKKDDGSQVSKLKKTAQKVNTRSGALFPFELEDEDEDENDDEDAHTTIPDSHTGYYGARGAQLFASTIVTQLRAQLSKAESDPIVSFGGVGYFVQKVLVPECTIQLVIQDMDVSEAVARSIIAESAAVGTLVNEEIEDRVIVVEESEIEAGSGREDRVE